MTRKEIEEKVFQVVSEKAELPKENLQLQNSFKQDLNLDSLEILDLIMALEDTFQMTIPDEEVENVKTIEDGVNYIITHLEES